MPELLAVVVALTVGYWAGRLRPLVRFDAWADSKAGEPHGLVWWATQAAMTAWVIAAIARAMVTYPLHVAWVITIHPRRARAAIRTARTAPAPDPHWADKRKDRGQ